jgi:hypothetical protein
MSVYRFGFRLPNPVILARTKDRWSRVLPQFTAKALFSRGTRAGVKKYFDCSAVVRALTICVRAFLLGLVPEG